MCIDRNNDIHEHDHEYFFSIKTERTLLLIQYWLRVRAASSLKSNPVRRDSHFRALLDFNLWVKYEDISLSRQMLSTITHRLSGVV